MLRPRPSTGRCFWDSAPKRPFSLERFFRWRCYSDYSGGIATDLFVHLCTTIHYLMDAKMPARAMAMGQLYRWKESRDVPDTLNAILEYPEGFTVSLSSTFNNEFSQESGFQILGTEGTLIMDYGGVSFHPEATLSDNSWIVESWPKALEDAYYRDPKVIAAEVEPAKNFKRPEPETFKDDAGPDHRALRSLLRLGAHPQTVLGRCRRRPSCRRMRPPDQPFCPRAKDDGMGLHARRHPELARSPGLFRFS